MPNSILEKPATIGDILAWNMAIPAVLSIWVPFYIATMVVPKFQNMFASLGGALPAFTNFIINWGIFFAVAVAGLILTLVFMGLFRVHHQASRLGLLALANIILFGSIGLYVLAIYQPILELQNAVRQ